MKIAWVCLVSVSFIALQSLDAGVPYRTIEVKDGGTVRGTVRLSGDVPRPTVFVTGKDPSWCGRTKTSQRLRIGKNNGVADGVVILEGITAGKKMEGNASPVLNQSGCDFFPHVVMVPWGTNFTIVNSDAVLHNIRASSSGIDEKTIFNIAQPIRGLRTTVKAEHFPRSGIYHVACDAGHPWMSAYIVVVDHPYCTVTDANGRFVLTDVPPGKYTLRIWHSGVALTRTEKRGNAVTAYRYEEPYEQTREIVVSAKEVVLADFSLSLRPAAYKSTSSN